MQGKLFDPHMVTLDTLFSNNFNIPVYQRPYSWGKEEVEDLYNDIMGAYDSRSKGTYEGIFAGTIYLKNKSKLHGKYDECFVIDGQQRITTFTLMFITLYCIAKKRNMQDSKEIEKIKDFLWRYVNKSHQKESRLLQLGNIDKDLLIKIFDIAYGNTNDLYTYINSFTSTSSEAEKHLIDNAKFFYQKLEEKFPDDQVGNDNLIDYIDFVLESTQFVLIYVNTSMNKVFEIFESINSKGKRLDEIDLIKSYIFQLISEKDHDEYLGKWGELITITNDSLQDYLYVYIKAYVKYYRVSISVRYFKALCKTELKNFFNVNTIEETVKKLIDDLIDKAKFYNMLKDSRDLDKKFNTAEFLFYYNSLSYLGYQHPKPLLFKALCQYDLGKINDKAVKSIFKNSFSFMITFQTLYNRDSKDSIAVFEDVLNQDYNLDQLDYNKIANTFKNRLMIEGINPSSLREKLREYKGYAKQDKSETIVLLAYYESINDKGKVAFDNANIILASRSMFEIDHILPVHPKANDSKIYYCKEIKNTGEEVLELKQGHDFPPNIQSGMDYNLFKEQILHKLGNLRIILSTKNRSKGNIPVILGNYGSFTTYNQTTKRSDDIADKLYNSELLLVV